MADDRKRPSILGRYLLLQVPGWMVIGLVMVLVQQWGAISSWTAAGIFLLWVIKDLALYPWLRDAYTPDPAVGAERLVGQRAVAVEMLAPAGYVRVRGELWKAEAIGYVTPVPPGTEVQIRGARGYTLMVEP